MRILVIEDDANVAGFVAKGLREAGHDRQLVPGRRRRVGVQ